VLRFSTPIHADFVATALVIPFFLGLFVCCLGLFVFWRVRRKYNKLKQRGIEVSALKPGTPSSSLPVSSLPVRTVRGLAYRAEASRVGQALSTAKKTAWQSLEKFAASAEIDKEIAKAVRGEFPTDKRTD
jgi:hypothetical protein